MAWVMIISLIVASLGLASVAVVEDFKQRGEM